MWIEIISEGKETLLNLDKVTAISKSVKTYNHPRDLKCGDEFIIQKFEIGDTVVLHKSINRYTLEFYGEDALPDYIQEFESIESRNEIFELLQKNLSR